MKYFKPFQFLLSVSLSIVLTIVASAIAVQAISSLTTDLVVDSTATINGTGYFVGNVGIGTTPGATYQLDVSGKLNATNIYISGVQKNTVWDAKEPAITAGTTAQYWRGDKTWQTLPAEVDAVIGNEVKNTSNTTLTRSGSGTSASPYTLELNLSNANTWTGIQNFSSGINWSGSSLSTSQGGSIELGNSGTPFIDFKNNSANDYDVRLGLISDDKFYITGGNVGIGTNDPAAELDVNGDIITNGIAYRGWYYVVVDTHDNDSNDCRLYGGDGDNTCWSVGTDGSTTTRTTNCISESVDKKVSVMTNNVVKIVKLSYAQDGTAPGGCWDMDASGYPKYKVEALFYIGNYGDNVQQ